jgi:hypothetical protein
MEYHAEGVQKESKYIIDKFLKECCCVGESERDNQRFEEAVAGPACCFPIIIFCDLNHDAGISGIQFDIPSAF